MITDFSYLAVVLRTSSVNQFLHPAKNSQFTAPFPPSLSTKPPPKKKRDFRFQQENKIESWDHPTQTFTQRQDTISSMPSSNSSSISPARIISLFMELIDSCRVAETGETFPASFGSGNSGHNFCLFDKLMLEIEGDIMVCGTGRMLVEFKKMLKTPVFAS